MGTWRRFCIRWGPPSAAVSEQLESTAAAAADDDASALSVFWLSGQAELSFPSMWWWWWRWWWCLLQSTLIDLVHSGQARLSPDAVRLMLLLLLLMLLLSPVLSPLCRLPSLPVLPEMLLSLSSSSSSSSSTTFPHLLLSLSFLRFPLFDPSSSASPPFSPHWSRCSSPLFSLWN